MALALLLLLGWMASAAAPASAFGSSAPPPLPSVSAGGYMSCAVDAGGSPACWGENGVPSNDVANTSPGGQANPPPEPRFLEVNAGYATACGITVTHTISCWGSGRYDKFVVPSGTFTHVVPGLNYVCALRTDGTVTCWGGEDSDPLAIVANNEPTGAFTELTVGNRHACALRADGSIACWGTNADGQLNVPAGTYSHVNVSNFTSCALRTDGTPVCWGRNQGGQQTYPTGTFTQISTGFAHVCGLRADQTITCWGRNAEGETVVPPGTYTQVSAGTFTACAMPTTGPPARCWGNNAAGRTQPSMTNLTPHQGYVASPYSLQLSMATYVSPPPTFTVASGTLPPGLTLSPAGLISGSPTAAGSFTFSVSASSLGLSPRDCSTTSVAGDSRFCTPGDPTSVATATRTFTIVIGAVAPAPGAIAGQVTRLTGGAPVAGVTITVTHSGGATAGTAVTDPSGSYTVTGLLPGSYNVTAGGQELQPQTKPATVASNATFTVSFALPPLVRPTVVRVSNNYYDTVTDGVFVDWSEVFEQRLDTPQSYTIHTDASCATPAIATAFRGNWLEIRPTIRDLEVTGWSNVVPGGTYWLRVAPDTEYGFTSQQRNALQCVQFIAELRPADEAVLVGRVTDAGRLPVSGATVVVTRTVGAPGTVAGQATTSATGEYRIENLAPGPYQVTMTPPGGPPQTINVTLVGGTTFTAGFGPLDAINDAYTTAEDTRLTVPAQGVLSNDIGGPLTAGSASAPAHGTVTLSADGSFVYNPAANYNGPDSFTYAASGPGGPDTATVNITVTPVNDLPVAANDTYTTAEDTALTVAAPGVLTNDTDVDGDVLTATSASVPAHGSVVLNTNGSFSYTPVANYSGPDSFTYVANDGNGGVRTATVNLTVTAVNDAPVAGADAYTTAEDTALTVAAPGVLTNDTDVDSATLTAGSASVPAHGSVVLNANGSFVYTPAANYNGSDSFTYVVSDGSGGSATGSVTLTITSANDAPVAAADAYTTAEDTALTVAAPGVLGNDTDVDSATLTAGSTSVPAHGSVVLNANGSFVYTPAANYNGSDSFTYVVSDGSGGSATGSVTLTITSVNDAPVAAADFYATAEDTPFTVAAPGVLGNDTDVEAGPLTAGSASDPPHGSVTLNADGSFAYTPDGHFNGTDIFTYTVTDANGGSATTTVTISVGRTDGYRLVASDGGIFSYGDARFFGSTGGMTLNRPIVGMANTPSENGYWLVASDGGIFAFGDATFFGSTGAMTLNRPIVGMTATPTGRGYWLVASDGGIFAFGDARFFGSTGAMSLNRPIVGMSSTPTGNGYWLVASDGGVFAYGDARFFASGPAPRNVVALVATPSGGGYWLVGSDGAVTAAGDATFFGSTGGVALAKPIVGMASTETGRGYWLVASDGGIFAFGDATFLGSTGGLHLNRPIVGMAGPA